MKKSNIIKSIIVIIIIFIIAASAIFIGRYKKAVQNAENTIAVYLAKNYADNHDGFNSFNKTYSTVKLKKFNCVVELGGNVSLSSGKYTRTFYSKVKVNLFTNKAKIETLKIEGRNKLK